METNFTVSCEKWVDSETPLTAEFSHHIKGITTVFYFREIPAGGKASATLWLPDGDKENGNILNVSAVVKDSLGARFTERFVLEVFSFYFLLINQCNNLLV